MLRAFKSQKGQTLIEALVSLSIAVTIIGAITVVVISSLNNAIFTRNQNQATQYAQEGIETVKRISQSQVSFFDLSQQGDYCLGPDLTLQLLVLPNPGRCPEEQRVDIFEREVNITHGNTDCSGNTKIIVTVQWADNKCTAAVGSPYCHKVELRSCLTDYNPSKSEGIFYE
ncbi:MAG: hypothetical protein ACD_50C00146G0002 [uncultured bacterium]|nr:MAG: hypothetical protein ACD_50C00146G0002 [uncultured bacterium]OGH52846.1 MAG: hypothetical protein A2423_02235 [Candidatus Levybacteria bacterium RIFOXYC1_FULL_40_10]